MKAIRKTYALDQGLMPVKNVPTSGKWLKQASGVRKGLSGLEMEAVPTYPLSVSVSWPWPQIVNLTSEVIVIQSDGLYTVDGTWSLTSLVSSSVDDSTMWQFADFGDIWFATNGSVVYKRDIEAGTISATDSTEFPQVTSLVAFKKGQLVGAGVQSSWYDCDAEYAVWGNIGSETFVPDWKNEAGYRHMGIGTIYRCLGLADQAVVFYGSEGVAMLTPAGATFSYQLLSKIPVLGKNAMGGQAEHLYISSEGKLYRISAEGREILGYQSYLSELSSSLGRILYDPIREDYHITDGSLGYIYANKQLTEATRFATQLCVYDDELVGAFEDNSGTIEIQLQEHDSNLVGMKSIEFLEFGLKTDGTVTAAVDFSYQLGQEERESTWKPVNNSGFVYAGVTANLLSPKLRVSDPSEFKLDYITYSLKVTDNRIQNQLQAMSDGSWNVN